jgi:hypothetical protein
MRVPAQIHHHHHLAIAHLVERSSYLDVILALVSQDAGIGLESWGRKP